VHSVVQCNDERALSFAVCTSLQRRALLNHQTAPPKIVEFTQVPQTVRTVIRLCKPNPL